MHFFVIPIVCDSFENSKYRLSCKDFFDKTALINLQADYCRDFNNELGREYVFEYKKNGKATHTTLKEFYKSINKTKEVIEAKELELKNLNSQLVLNKYLADSKIELLEKKNENLESENKTLKSILSSVKVTLSRYFTDKLKFFDFDVLHFFRIKTDNEEKSETEKMIEYFERNELDKQLNNPNESNEDNEDFYRNLNLKLKPKL
ncbi:plasmid recombination protein [Shewanella putrefaciens]|nr:plasmid recombination protein [Shewanella putrefaciens]